MGSKFVLIGGTPRSGTNLARRIIGSHSKIAVPPSEFNFFNQHRSGKSVRAILSAEPVKRWGVDLSDLYSRPHREAFIAALVRYAESLGKEIPGEKTPYNEFYYETIRAWLEGFDLKFVHLVRNPFDVIASYKHAPFRGAERHKRYDVAALCRNWVRSVSIGLARAHTDPETYCLVKYEDLTTNPARTTESLCAFLGVEFEPERMLNLADYKGYADNTSFPQDSASQSGEHTPIHPPRSRKGYLTRSEIRTVSALCGELAHALGYEDADFHPAPPEPLGMGLRKRVRRTIRRRLVQYLSSLAL